MITKQHDTISLIKWPTIPANLPGLFQVSWLKGEQVLPYEGREKIATILQTPFWNVYSYIRLFVFWFKFYWNCLPSIQVGIGWDNGLTLNRVMNHYCNHWWASLLVHICVARWITDWPYHMACTYIWIERINKIQGIWSSGLKSAFTSNCFEATYQINSILRQMAELQVCQLH